MILWCRQRRRGPRTRASNPRRNVVTIRNQEFYLKGLTERVA